MDKDTIRIELGFWNGYIIFYNIDEQGGYWTLEDEKENVYNCFYGEKTLGNWIYNNFYIEGPIRNKR